MEEVLHDIYLAEAEIETCYNIFSSDSMRRRELLNSVLKKNKITEAVLDTSLAWYAGHLEKYVKINEKLSKRFEETLEKVKQHEEASKKSDVTTPDHLILPIEKERFLLRQGDLSNKAYTFKADTTLDRYGGAYELQFDVSGLSASLHPVVTLCVQCRDTTFVRRDTISQDGLFASSLNILQGKQAQKLYGSIYFPEIYSETIVFIQNFTLSYSLRLRNLEKQ